MARIRSIHPGLFTDEAFMSASAYARLLLMGIWCEAADDGVFHWKPLTLKARIFPVDAVDIAALLSELEGLSFIRRFDAGGKAFGAIRNFRKYQRPKKPTSSGVLPPEFETYVGLSGDGSGEEGNQGGTGGGKSQQREEGGGKREDEEGKENDPPPALRPQAQQAGGQAFEDGLEGKNAAFDEAARRLRSAWHERGLEPPDMSRVELWLEQGHSVATIVAVVRERLAAGGSKARGLSYFDRPLAEAKPQQDEPKPLGACMPTVYVRQLDSAWPVYAEAWKAAKGKPPPTDRAGGWHFPIDLIPAEHS